jgi:hypothetical protein
MSGEPEIPKNTALCNMTPYIIPTLQLLSEFSTFRPGSQLDTKKVSRMLIFGFLSA